MSDTTTLKTGTATLRVNTIGLIAGISIVGTALLIILVVGIIFWCRKLAKKRDRDRSTRYMVQDGASPFSSLHAPSSGADPSINGLPNQWGSSYFIAPGYDNKAAEFGEFRPNPLAESPFGRNIPQYGSKQQRYLAPQPSRSPAVDEDSFYASLYERLQDTIHSNRGRPLYLCKRENYQRVGEYFDVVGKTRTNDLLIRPRDGVPNRPVKKSKKNKAPKPGNDSNSRQQIYRTPSYRENNGYMGAPFGPGNRMPTRFVGSAYHRGEEGLGAGYTSLPRDGNLHNAHDSNNGKVRRQTSQSTADQASKERKTQLDEKRYAQVLKRNSLQGGTSSTDQTNRHYSTWDTNPQRRPISTIEEVPHSSKVAGKSTSDGQRERTGSVSTVKSLGITDEFKFLEQYDTEEERF